MTTVGTGVRERVAEAEELLVGLAVPGTPAHESLTPALTAALGSVLGSREPGPATPLPAAVLIDALGALAEQARLCLRAGRRASVTDHWLASTTREWQLYLRWLVATQRSFAPQLAALAGSDRAAAEDVWGEVNRECETARRVWGALAWERPTARTGRLTAPVGGDEGGTPRPSAQSDELAAVTVRGRVYVSVDELAGSLRDRADAFAGAAAVSAEEQDDVGELVSGTVSAELTSRADALDVAGIELASEDGDEPPDP